MTGKVLLGTALLVAGSASAHAGGLFLPGTGPVSTGRAGAAIASTEGPEAIAANPAGMAKSEGTQITVGSSLISHSQSFQRNGSYDSVPGQNLAWAGERYGVVEDNAKPKIGFGSFQAIPLIGVTHNFDCVLKGFSAGFAIFAPNAYPTRSIGDDYQLDDASQPPPPTRYDIVSQNATAINPTVAVAYRVLPQLDVGARFTWGISQVDSRRFTWVGENYPEWGGSDSSVVLKAKDSFVPGWAAGLTYRPLPALEVAAQYTAAMKSHAVGSAVITPSKDARLSNQMVFFTNAVEPDPLCQPGTSSTELKACVDFMLPMFASVGGRYKFNNAAGKMRGDIELNVQWENWSAASDTKASVKGLINGEIDIKDAYVRHGFRDTYSVRVGGSYNSPVAGHDLTVRGGAAYDSGAAKPGWERLDFDGAARIMATGGASYRLDRYQFDLGAGVALQGTRNVGGDCNPTKTMPGCLGNGQQTPVLDRAGWDPGQAAFPLESQAENPVNHGQYKSHYVLIMLGATTWF